MGNKRKRNKRRTTISMKDGQSFPHPRPEIQPPTSTQWAHRASHPKPEPRRVAAVPAPSSTGEMFARSRYLLTWCGEGHT